MKKKALYILFVWGFLTSIISCQDDFNIGYDYDPSLKGTSEVSFNMDFRPLVPVLESRTAGHAIKHINDLNVVIYKVNENSSTLYKHFYIERGTDGKLQTTAGNELLTNITETESGTNYPESEKGDDFAESTTCRTSFKYSLPFGQYKIIAVANCGELTDTEVKSESNIRNKQLSWNSDVTKNAQMFGFFRTSTQFTDGIGNAESTEILTINAASTQLHAWMKRAASKVTVAYNGSRLNENVYITLKSVQIKDIPKNCTLGLDYAAKKAEDLIADGEKIQYNNNPVITKGGVITNTDHVEGWENPYDPTGEDSHTETSQALYFYENLQGKGESGQPTDKSINELLYNNKGKDYGTYIEVKAHYENKNEEIVSSGDITYRFMLGKDITIDYNAERNYHYKLTLFFKNDANDVDWRIEYKEEPGIYVPNPYYISYLYSEKMNLPLKVVLDKNDKIEELKAQIIENNWEPDGNTSALGSDYYGNVQKKYKAKATSGIVTGTIGSGNTNIPWIGFLSLKDEYKLNGNKIYLDGGFGTNIDLYRDSDKPYTWWNNNKLGNQTYKPTKVETTGTNTQSVSYSIPFYTRVKQLYSVTGFTGNNPYVGYNRTAKVKFTATTKKGTTYTKEVKIIQVKRLVNPTGIWRSANNTSSFNVVLKEQDENGGNFNDLISQGPWSVTIRSTNAGQWFTLSTTGGPTGSRVAFTYKPNGTTTTPRCGIIEVKYHNNTCSHLIYVRQGYDPIQIVDGGVKWHSFNMKTSNAETTSPLDEGSLYRWGKWEYPIAEINNSTTGLKYGEAPGSTKFTIVGGTTTTWSNIGNTKYTDAFTPPISGTIIATLEDWYTLKNQKQGYGVLYGDDATTVATTEEDVYGYRETNSNKARGMRGVFAYNDKTSAHVFFPISAIGFGHRRENNIPSDGYAGVLRYGQVNNPLSVTNNAEYRPMLYDLYAQKGAIYWTSSSGNAWDINFNQFDFNEYSIGNAWTKSYEKSDACFIRLVDK